MKYKYLNNYLKNTIEAINKLDRSGINKAIREIIKLKKRKGRLFLLGVGGSGANCSHAVNDFRKICHIEAYTPLDNVAELTARTNDDGWNSVFVNWLKISHLTNIDMVMVFSVGGGNLKKNTSVNIVKALKYTKSIGAKIIGIVSRDGGYTKKVADITIQIPIISHELITPLAESLQPVIWHAIVNHPELKS